MGPLLGSQETNRAHDVAEDDPGGADQSSDDRHQVVVQHEALGAQGPAWNRDHVYLINHSKPDKTRFLLFLRLKIIKKLIVTASNPNLN